MTHVPVLLNEAQKFLEIRPGNFIIDGTLGGGGYAKAILNQLKHKGVFLGIDWDKDVIQRFQNEIISKGEVKVIFVNDNFKNLPAILKENKLGKADGLVLDLGFSSIQIESSERGFSFKRNEPLLMTYGENQKPAHQWLRELKEKQLSKIIEEYGEERYAGQIAKAIKKNLPILTTGKLADVILKAVPKRFGKSKIHPATRTFLALRSFVNQELDNLKKILDEITEILAPNGKLIIISFNSLEDRIVKNEFKRLSAEKKAEVLTKKPMKPSFRETKINPRARSAKLRALKII